MTSFIEKIIRNLVSDNAENSEQRRFNKKKGHKDFSDHQNKPNYSNYRESDTSYSSTISSIFQWVKKLFVPSCPKCGSDNVDASSYDEPRSTYSAPSGLVTSSDGRKSHAVYEVGITTTIINCRECGHSSEKKTSYKRQIDSFMK
jgi:hypothetical protein